MCLFIPLYISFSDLTKLSAIGLPIPHSSGMLSCTSLQSSCMYFAFHRPSYQFLHQIHHMLSHNHLCNIESWMYILSHDYGNTCAFFPWSSIYSCNRPGKWKILWESTKSVMNVSTGIHWASWTLEVITPSRNQTLRRCCQLL